MKKLKKVQFNHLLAPANELLRPIALLLQGFLQYCCSCCKGGCSRRWKRPPSRGTAADGCRLAVRLGCSPNGLTGGEGRTRLATLRTTDGDEEVVAVDAATLTSCGRRYSSATTCWAKATRTRSSSSSSRSRSRCRWPRGTAGWTRLSWQNQILRPVCLGFGVSMVMGMVARLEG